MKNVFVPDYTADKVTDIDFERLAEEGVRCVIFDADNTLLSYEETAPREEIKELCRRLRSKNICVCILSNGHSRRIRNVADSLEMDFIGDALKPVKKGFKRCLDKYGLRPREAVVVGDQIFTDIWGAGRAGCVSVLVKPIKLENEPGFVKVKRVLEKPFMRNIGRNALKMEER